MKVPRVRPVGLVIGVLVATIGSLTIASNAYAEEWISGSINCVGPYTQGTVTSEVGTGTVMHYRVEVSNGYHTLKATWTNSGTQIRQSFYHGSGNQKGSIISYGYIYNHSMGCHYIG